MRLPRATPYHTTPAGRIPAAQLLREYWRAVRALRAERAGERPEISVCTAQVYLHGLAVHPSAPESLRAQARAALAGLDDQGVTG